MGGGSQCPPGLKARSAPLKRPADVNAPAVMIAKSATGEMAENPAQLTPVWPLEQNTNMPTAADLRKLADRLAQRAGAGARLTPESATLAMVALRVYADLLEQPSIETLGQPYEVAVVDAREHKTEILALCRNVIVAKAAFVAAVEQRAGKRVKLTRGAQVHADSGDKQ